MLEVSRLSRNYGPVVAADQVSFSIGKGEIVGLLGRNGAGKTTIMKMLSGFLEPDQGSITLDGVDLADNRQAVQRNLGYLPENLPIYPELTVADYLEYAAVMKGLTGEHRVVQIRRAIDATEIGDKLLTPIATLSRGFKQRVGVAQAILGQPGFLIMDEPTNGLDPTQTEHMRQLIREIARSATVLLSTHIMQEVDAVCDRVLILRAGRLVVDEQLDALRRSNQLLLDTSLAPDAARTHLATLGTVTELEVLAERALPGAHRYRIRLQPEADTSTAGAGLARAVIAAGADLYQLRNEHRDLETLFREVSTAPTEHPGSHWEELNHAA